MIVSMAMIKSTDSYYCGLSHQTTFQNKSRITIWIWRVGRIQKIVVHLILGELTSPVKTQSWRAPVIRRNQSRVPIWSLVILLIESNSSHDPKTLQNWLFFWNNSTTIKEILMIEYLFFIYTLKFYNSIFSNLRLQPKYVPKHQILKPLIFILLCTHACGLLISHSTIFFPPIFTLKNKALICSLDYIK